MYGGLIKVIELKPGTGFGVFNKGKASVNTKVNKKSAKQGLPDSSV